MGSGTPLASLAPSVEIFVEIPATGFAQKLSFARSISQPSLQAFHN
jgi:hypothetical protein